MKSNEARSFEVRTCHKTYIFIFFDFESIQHKSEDNTYLHIPNLCILDTVCSLCWNSEEKSKTKQYCSFCTGNKIIFFGNDAIKFYLKNSRFNYYTQLFIIYKQISKQSKQIKQLRLFYVIFSLI